jgi:uncharacterized membrane protein
LLHSGRRGPLPRLATRHKPTSHPLALDWGFPLPSYLRIWNFPPICKLENSVADDDLKISKAKDAAEREYYFLQGEVGRYDQLSHGIKNWSITVSFALIAASFYRGTSTLCILAAIAALMFWLTEARWKRYQTIHISRIKELEKFLRGETDIYLGPQINKSFVEKLGTLRDGRRQELRIMWLGNVRRPHYFIVLLGLLVFALDFLSALPSGSFSPASTP